jgi:hypothetical protein
MPFPNCFIDSFNHYSTSDLFGLGNGMKWGSTGLGSSTGNMFISGGTGLFGNSLRIVANNTNINVSKVFNNLTTWVIGFRFKLSGLPSTPPQLLSLIDTGTVQVDLKLNTNGTLFVTRAGTTVTGGTSTNALATNTWYYVEMMVTINPSISANTWQVNVNGANWINVAAGQSSRNTGNSTANQLALGIWANGYGTTPTLDYCDFYCDGGGSVNGGAFWGDTKIECHWPVAVGTYSAWTPVNGLGVGCINDETPNGDLNYLSDNTTNDKSTFTFQPLGATPSSIMCVQTVYDVRKNDAGTRQVADYCYSGGTGVAGATNNPGNTYLMYTNVLAQDPHTSAAWTASGLNAAEFGVEEIG